MTHEPMSYVTIEEQQTAQEYLTTNNIPESQTWIDGDVLRIKSEELQA